MSVTCDEVREQLAEHLLGTLDPEADDLVSAHLRGCSACRRDVAALAEGVGTFALASHDREPPAELRDRVLAVLDQEWQAVPSLERGPRRRRWAAAAVGIAALVAALAWGATSTIHAQHVEAAASKYEAFLDTLGGRNVRLGTLHAPGSQDLHGSVVMYDSSVGQSWVLVLCRAPGWSDTANVTLRADDGRTISMHAMEFGPGGEGSTWLVTSSDLRSFDHVSVWDDSGVIATATVERE
jgi:predicted anti-sigma-YlaC factor YlaD